MVHSPAILILLISTGTSVRQTSCLVSSNISRHRHRHINVRTFSHYSVSRDLLVLDSARFAADVSRNQQ
jgi:hypothetical protein